MKKFFVLAVVCFLGIFNANAQLNVKSVTKEKDEKVMTIQMGYSYLYKTSVGYTIYLNTNNRFDKFTTVFLGETLDDAYQTLCDLKSLIDEEIASVVVEQFDGDLHIVYKNELGVKQLLFKQDGNAGISWITLKQIEKIVKTLKNV